MQKIEITQKEYNELKIKAEELLNVTAELQTAKTINEQRKEHISDLEKQVKDTETLIFKEVEIKEVFKKENAELKNKIEVLEEETKTHIEHKRELEKSFKKASSFEKGYNDMKASLKSLFAHIK